MGWWDKTKDYAEKAANYGSYGLYGTAKGALRQDQKAEAYDPNAANFQLYGDPAAAQAEAQRAQGLAADQLGAQQGLAQQGAAQEQLGAQSQAQAGVSRGQAWQAQGRGGPTLDPAQAGRAAALSGQTNLYGLARQPEGPSAAEALLNSQGAAATRQNLAMARSGRGTNQAQALRGAIEQNTVAQGDVANQAAAMRAGERQAYEQRRLQATGMAAQQGMALYGQDANMSQAQGQMDLAARGQNDAYSLGLGSQALGYEQAALGRTSAAQGYGQMGLGYGQQALGYEGLAQGYGQMGMTGNMGYEQLAGGQVLGASTANAEFEAKRDAAVIGGASAMGAGLATKSDRRAKTHIEELGSIRALLDGKTSKRVARDAKPYRYQYAKKHKDTPGAGRGTFVGPMAQDLEKSPVGKSLVRNVGGTKMVDSGRAGLVALSAVGEVSKELDAIRESLGGS